MIEQIPDRLERTLRQTLMPNERVLVKLKGAFKEALVCTDARVLILKGGWMTGQILGTNTFQCPLLDGRRGGSAVPSADRILRAFHGRHAETRPRASGKAALSPQPPRLLTASRSAARTWRRDSVRRAPSSCRLLRNDGSDSPVAERKG
jgi:hypothetical protein